VSFRGVRILQESGHIRAAFSSKYLHDVFYDGFKLYREDLIGAIVKSRTGKPARANVRPPELEEAHLAMPKDGGRASQNKEPDE
jgi:hypothetical protein